ncbi:hypothetical protein KM043_008223 [Ampulex compressa]|nr:hypothetical protein KM043_008223 [Ampulex compressa]
MRKIQEYNYFLPTEVVVHNSKNDCWVSYLGGVYDLTELCQIWAGTREIKPILAHAGKDISHWFDHRTNDIRHHVHPITGVLVPYCPHGPIPDVSPCVVPSTTWHPLNRCPWWLDERYKKGYLTKNPRPCKITNVLTGTQIVILVCEEDSIARIQERTLRFHSNCKSYVWKFEGKILDLTLTLTENGIPDERDRFVALGLPEDFYIPNLMCYYVDDRPTHGIALELNHIDTKCKVSTCSPSEECLRRALQDAKVVLIVAGKAFEKKPSQQELLEVNADVLSDLLSDVIKFSPRALVAIAMNPINSLIPLATEMYKRAGIYEYNRLFGVTALDCVRANTFAAEVIGIEPEFVTVPVIGGSCPKTRIPIFSQARPYNKLSQEESNRLTYAVRMSDEELSKVRKEKTMSSYAMAFATARFCMSLCKALGHQKGIVECAYVRSCVIPEVTYFASALELGPDGIQKHLGIPPLNDYECKLLATAIPVLKSAIKDGETLALGRKAETSELCPRYPPTCDGALAVRQIPRPPF